MYIRNRFDKDNNIIENPDNYVPQHTEELQEFLNGIYFNTDKNFTKVC